MTAGSISLSGLLGGTAGQIDTTTLISQLMQAAAVPQRQLQDQLSTVQVRQSAYQAINSALAGLQTAAQALTDPTAWQATAATSSSSAVSATSSNTASPGSTTFSVTQLARTQVSSISADAAGNVVSQPAAGITITDGSGVGHSVVPSSGSAADVASAINAANIGIRASVVHTSSGLLLQVSSAKSGAANAFTIDGSNTSTPPRTVSAAQDAAVTVGDPSAGGYTVTSSSNTFTSLIPGVTFSANALAADVTLTVSSDGQSISDKVSALVNAANAASTTIAATTAKGAVLQGQYDANSVGSQVSAAVSHGTSSGGSLKNYGIDINSTGQMSFDAKVFAAAYAADPAGTKAAIGDSFAATLDTTVTAAIAPITGTITTAIANSSSQSTKLNTEIATWTTKLASIHTNLQTKYTTMETTLARLQSQQTYLTSMFKGMSGSSSSSN